MYGSLHNLRSSLLKRYRSPFRGTSQPLTVVDTAQMSPPQNRRRGSVVQSVRHYFTRLQTEIQQRHGRCAARVQELMAQPRRRQTQGVGPMGESTSIQA